MHPYFFVYKSIGITWFTVLSLMGILGGYFITKNLGKEYVSDAKKLEDVFVIILIIGFVGARLTYVFFHRHIYEDNLLYMLKLSHMNLSLTGGLFFGMGTIFVMAKKYKISFYQLFNAYVVPFYFAMAMGVWSMFFDGVLIGKEYEGFLSIYYMGNQRHPITLYLSGLFLVGILIESIAFKTALNQYISYIAFILMILLYYWIKVAFS
ncbi:prolipoprotein diacylglyceryl transferase [Clostridiaceae bacterium 35-E11]